MDRPKPPGESHEEADSVEETQVKTSEGEQKRTVQKVEQEVKGEQESDSLVDSAVVPLVEHVSEGGENNGVESGPDARDEFAGRSPFGLFDRVIPFVKGLLRYISRGLLKHIYHLGIWREGLWVRGCQNFLIVGCQMRGRLRG